MSNEETKRASGGCLCGALRYRVRGPLRPVVACHCTQCRRASGHYTASTACRHADLVIEDEATLTWYESSPGVERGFCGRCGSSLFWRSGGADTTAIFAGSLDRPSGLKLVQHIFTEDAGDYYEITDGLPSLPQDGNNVEWPEA